MLVAETFEEISLDFLKGISSLIRDKMEHRLLAAHYFLLLGAFLSRPKACNDCKLLSSMRGCCAILRMAEDNGESWCLVMKWSFGEGWGLK